MTEPKFTPGPWMPVPTRTRLNCAIPERAIHENGRWIITPEYDYERSPIAEVDHGNDTDEDTRKQAEYDTHLIAAAPELYGMLSAVLEGFENYNMECLYKVDKEEIESLLAKARGEL